MRKKDDYYYENLHWHGLDEENFEIYIGGEEYTNVHGDYDPGVEYLMSNRLIRNMRAMGVRALKADKPILIHMKTCGGYWEEGMAIYHAIKACPVKVIILSYTHARSMSSIILQAADKRVLMPDSVFMIHWGSESIDGESKTVNNTMDFYRHVYKIDDRMLNCYVDRIALARPDTDKTKLKRKLIKAIETHNDKYYTAEQAVAEGFADEVFDYDWEKLKKNVEGV